VQLLPTALLDGPTAVIAAMTAVALFLQVNPAWCLLAGAAIGLAVRGLT
jgi:hypothetical protein